MTTGTPFTPTPFTTSVVAPEVISAFRRTPYISPSEFVNAPTAVSTTSLIPGGNAQQNLQVVADTILRASSWIDLLCFHTADGTLAASPSTESATVKLKPSGDVVLICNYRPILEVLSIAVGYSLDTLSSLTTAPSMRIGQKTITIPPVVLGAPVGDTPTWPATPWSPTFAVWQYVNGYPHTYLAAACGSSATSIVVAPSIPGGSTVYGVYPGTQMTIRDGVNTEVITISSASGTTLNLQGVTQYAHTPPASPDSIRVSALPWAVEQACISLTSCLIKMRGTKAAVLPMQPGGTSPGRDALIEAGGLEDFEVACKLLAPFRTVFAGHN